MSAWDWNAGINISSFPGDFRFLFSQTCTANFVSERSQHSHSALDCTRTHTCLASNQVNDHHQHHHPPTSTELTHFNMGCFSSKPSCDDDEPAVRVRQIQPRRRPEPTCYNATRQAMQQNATLRAMQPRCHPPGQQRCCKCTPARR